MSDTSDFDLSIRQFTEAWRLMCTGGSPLSRRSVSVSEGAASVAAVDGVEYIFSGCPIAFFNVAVVTGRAISADTLKSHADNARAWASNKNVPWLFVTTLEALDAGVDATTVLDGCELAPMVTLTGMLAQSVGPAANIPKGLELKVPHDDAGCSALLDVNGLAYGMDLEAAKDLVGAQSFWANHFPVLGLIDGQPVCCAAVLMVDGCRYVALVATDPARQRRGYADAAMRRALELSAQAHGERYTVLHATDAGRPVYARMGYTPISAHAIFIDKAFLTGH